MIANPSIPTASFLLTVRTRSPLTIAARHWVRGEAVETLRYIPGTTLRGAIAGQMLRRGVSAQDATFRGLLERPEVRYGNLYPLVGERVVRSLPLPATARSCKVAAGFLHNASGNISDEHGVRDMLVARVKGTDWDGCFRNCNFDQEGRECGAKMDPFAGFYAEGDDGICWSSDASTHLITRTALSNEREVAAQGQLYIFEALDAGQTLSGYITVAEAWAAKLEQELGRAEPLRIGAARSRGQGEVEVIACPPAPGGHLGLAPLESRLARLEQSWAGVWPEDRFAFAITMYSDAILLDELTRYQGALTPEALHTYGRYWSETGESPWPDDLRLEHALGSTRQVSGWNSAHRLPRWEAFAVSRGAVSVFSVPAAEKDAVIRLLARLEAEGLGERRREGFGQVIVADPFHSRNWEVEKV